jgi:hypothetical protein
MGALQESPATNPWRELPETGQLVLRSDADLVKQFNARVKPDHRLHLNLIPEPYLGNPIAPVVLLNLNPGFHKSGESLHRDRDFRRAARDNLLHARKSWPFYLLDPSLKEGRGRKWWLSCLSALIDEVGSDKTVASSIFVAEIHGYHSKRYRRQRPALPSQRYTVSLVQQALARNALCLIMRGAKYWRMAVPGLEKCPKLRNPRNPSISCRNCGSDSFAEIVRRVRDGN